MTWNTAPFAVSAPPAAAIASPVNNFARLDNGNLVAGHVTVLAGTPAGTVKRVDVTEYVRASGSGTVAFVLSRRLRHAAHYGARPAPYPARAGCQKEPRLWRWAPLRFSQPRDPPARPPARPPAPPVRAGTTFPIPADTLSGGASVSFGSRSSAAPPLLRVFSTGAAYTSSTLFGISYGGAARAGRRSLLQAASDPVATGEDTTTVPAIAAAMADAVGNASHAVALAGYSVVAFLGVPGATAAAFPHAAVRAMEEGAAEACGVRRRDVEVAGAQPFPGGAAAPLSVSGFDASPPDMGLAAAQACTRALSALRGTASPIERRLAAAGLLSGGAAVVVAVLQQPELNRLFQATSTATVADAASSTDDLGRSVENAVSSGALAGPLSAALGARVSLTRPGKFSSDACLGGAPLASGPPSSAAPAVPAPGSTSGAAAVPESPDSIKLSYERKNVVVAAAVGSIGGVVLGALIAVLCFLACCWRCGGAAPPGTFYMARQQQHPGAAAADPTPREYSGFAIPMQLGYETARRASGQRGGSVVRVAASEGAASSSGGAAVGPPLLQKKKAMGATGEEAGTFF